MRGSRFSIAIGALLVLAASLATAATTKYIPIAIDDIFIVIPITVPDAPVDVAQIDDVQDRVILSWSPVAGATSYKIFAKGSADIVPVLLGQVPGSTFTTGTLPLDKYEFHVEACSASACTASPPVLFANERVIYLHPDLLGSPVAATNESYGLEWSEKYEPYGTKLGVPATGEAKDVGFTGHQFDASTGLTYMGGRYYDSRVGRFLSNDPVGFSLVNPASFNRYAYSNNNPYRYVDPDGRNPVSPLDLYDFGKDNGKVLVNEIVWVAATLLGDGGVADIAVQEIATSRTDAMLSTAGVVSPIPAAGRILKAAGKAEDIAKVAKSTEKYTAGGKFSRSTKKTAAERASNTCEYCRSKTIPAKKSERGVTPPKKEAATDHINPRSRGGTNSPDNAAHACRECNGKFSDEIKADPRNTRSD